MWGWASALAAAVAVLATVAIGQPQPAGAVHASKNCGIVSVGSRDYRVRAQKVECDRALRGAKRYLRKGAGLSGFSCDAPDGRLEFFCKDGTKVYWAVRL
jgi:hypothetical protein